MAPSEICMAFSHLSIVMHQNTCILLHENACQGETLLFPMGLVHTYALQFSG